MFFSCSLVLLHKNFSKSLTTGHLVYLKHLSAASHIATGFFFIKKFISISFAQLKKITDSLQLKALKCNPCTGDAYTCVEGKMYQIINIDQDFQYRFEVCPSVRFGSLEIDKIADQEIADIYQQVNIG